MRKWLVRIIFLTISGQSIAYFVNNGRFELLLLGKSWEPLHLVLFFIFWLWLVTFPLESRSSIKPVPALPARLKVLYILSGALLLSGILRGIEQGYFVALSYAEMLFWPFALIPIGWSLQMEPKEWGKHLRLLILPALLLAAARIISIIGRVFLRLPVPGYMYYNELFLIALGFLFYFVRVIILASRQSGDLLALVLTTLSIMLDFNKAIILPLISSVIFLLMTQYLKQRGTRGSSLGRLIAFALPIVMYSVILIAWTDSDYFLLKWQHRFLHLDIGDISGGRFGIWERAWFYIQREPWLGYGLGVRFSKVQDVFEISAQQGLGIHNQYLLLFMALGIPGASLILVALTYLVVFTTKKMNLKTPNDNTHIILSLWGFVWMMLTYGLVSLWSTTSVGYTLLGLGIGIVLRLLVVPHTAKQDPRGASTLLHGVTLEQSIDHCDPVQSAVRWQNDGTQSGYGPGCA